MFRTASPTTLCSARSSRCTTSTSRLGKFKEIVARCLGCTKDDALRTLNVTLEKVLHLKPLHEYGFKEEDVKAFALSVDANQQRLITNSYRPWSIELSERVYKECF